MEEIDLKELDLDVRYSGINDCITIDGNRYDLKDAFEIALKLQSVSAEILSYIERKHK